MVKLDHLTLTVRSRESARDWYLQNLGLTLEFELPDRGVAAVQDSGGFTIFLEESAISSSGCVLYFQVDSVAESYQRMTAHGVPFTIAPDEQMWGYGAELADPDGHRIRIWDAASMKTTRD